MFNISDRRLWGNEAADDENPQILNSYFFLNPDYQPFFAKHEKLMISRAKKGMGKSALINELAYRLSKDENSIVLNIKGNDLIAQRPVNYGAPDEHIHDWMQRICMLINREIGGRINFASNDDEILLVESSELSGYKRRNLVGSLLSRIKLKTSNAELCLPVVTDNIKLLERIINRENFNIWILVDDIDAIFVNKEEERRRLSTFFTACREISSSYKGVNLRCTIRSDVWASIRKDDESLDKVEQYILDLHWSRSDMGKLLAKRINSFETRVGKLEPLSLREQKDINNLDDSKLGDKRESWEHELNKAFPPIYPWGKGWRQNYDLLYMLGGKRPRWVLQLCRMASEIAKKNKAKRIKLGHIKQVLEKYCSIRVDDICREHQHQCQTMPEIINLFYNNKSSYTTNELLQHIDEAFQKNLNVTIDGVEIHRPIEVARFLFRASFFHAQCLLNNNIKYFSFEERPELLKYESNPDNGVQWTIQPAFRSALNIEQVQG